VGEIAPMTEKQSYQMHPLEKEVLAGVGEILAGYADALKKHKLVAGKRLLRQFPTIGALDSLLEALRRESDRSAAIMALALLDGMLERLISHRLVHKDPDILGKLFQDGGPLGDFHSKILMATALGIIAPHRRIFPNCYVQYYSEGLWTHGLPALVAEFNEWVKSLGGEILRSENVSRADWAFDYELSNIDFTDDDFVTRADKAATWSQHQKLQTVQLGKGHIVVRVYDKVAEIQQQSSKHFFFDLWGQKENVWRTEFQVRRERLKLAGINKISDIADFQGDLLHMLANDHTRLCIPGMDQNRGRWPLHPLWRGVIRDVKDFSRHGLLAALSPDAGLSMRLYRQLQSLYGDLKGVGALIQLIDRAAEPPFLGDTLRDLHHLLEPHHCQQAWNQALTDRVQKWRCGQW